MHNHESNTHDISKQYNTKLPNIGLDRFCGSSKLLSAQVRLNSARYAAGDSGAMKLIILKCGNSPNIIAISCLYMCGTVMWDTSRRTTSAAHTECRSIMGMSRCISKRKTISSITLNINIIYQY